MAQRTIEMLIGRLITDEDFREEFLGSPEKALRALIDCGFDINRIEIAALVSTDPALWERTAEGIDSRLRKVSLKNQARVS